MKRKLGQSAVHPIGLGCMNLSWAYGDPPPHDDKVKLLHRALELGYDHLDTARIYGLGKNEELIGEALKGKRDQFYLASKTGIIVEGQKRSLDCRPQTIAEQLEISLKLLQTDHIDLYYMHRFDPNVPIADCVGAMARAVEQGKIGGYGISEWSSKHIREAHAVHPVTAVQTEYSLWTRNPELGVLDTCKDLGIAFVAFSPVGRGALGGELKDPSTLGEKDLRRGMPRFDPEHWPHNHSLIERFNEIADDEGVAPAQLAMAWLLAQGDHVHAIPGTTSIAHLEENFRTPEVEISDAAFAAASELINQQSVSGHRYSASMRASIDTEDYE